MRTSAFPNSTMPQLRFRMIAAATVLSAAFAAPAFAQEASTATGGTIVVTQQPLRDILGKITVLEPFHLKEYSRQETKSLRGWPGTYTIIVEPPEGASTTIRLYRGPTQLQSVERPQITFSLAAGEDLSVSIHYNFNRVGEIAISSDPQGLGFTMEGPNRLQEIGVTPASFSNMPEGQYAVRYDQIPGCGASTLKSLQLTEKARISFHIKLACDAAEVMRQENKDLKENFITIQTENQEVSLLDVPQDAWFAPFVFDAAKGGIISGYKDANGNYTGEFKPENLVTVAELAKMAHRVAGVIEADITSPSENPRVGVQWFASLIASAEHRGWTIFADATVDPTRPATRAEVIVTLLQALDVPVEWPKGGVFTDVTWRTPFAGAIETAASAEVIAGRSDEHGDPTGLFEPNNPVNRAEMTKILVKAADAYRK